jgi:hypothetical protein
MNDNIFSAYTEKDSRWRNSCLFINFPDSPPFLPPNLCSQKLIFLLGILNKQINFLVFQALGIVAFILHEYTIGPKSIDAYQKKDLFSEWTYLSYLWSKLSAVFCKNTLHVSSYSVVITDSQSDYGSSSTFVSNYHEIVKNITLF